MTFSRIGVIWAPFGVQNGDFRSSRSIFSVHLETLVTTGAPKGKMPLIYRPPWVPFGDNFRSFFSQKSFGNQKSCHCKLHGAGTCESHESCRKKVIPEPSDWSSRCSGSSIYTIPFDPRKCRKWAPKMSLWGGSGFRFWYLLCRRGHFSHPLGGLFSKGAPD